MIKNCSAILGDRIWPKVESSLMANVKPGLRNDFKTILANTRQSLLAENLTSNLVYLPASGELLKIESNKYYYNIARNGKCECLKKYFEVDNQHLSS